MLYCIVSLMANGRGKENVIEYNFFLFLALQTPKPRGRFVMFGEIIGYVTSGNVQIGAAAVTIVYIVWYRYSKKGRREHAEAREEDKWSE